MSGTGLSVSALFAEREARLRHDKEAEEQLRRRKEEELAEFRKRLDNFKLTDESSSRASTGSSAPSSAARPSS